MGWVCGMTMLNGMMNYYNIGNSFRFTSRGVVKSICLEAIIGHRDIEYPSISEIFNQLAGWIIFKLLFWPESQSSSSLIG